MALTQYDLLVKGGEVIDPGQNLHALSDVAVADGRIVSIEESIPISRARQIVGAAGRVVTPGLIDMHTHVYWGATPLSVDADAVAASSGVTTFVDAGSSGASNFPGFRRYVIERSRGRILSFLNISSGGLIGAPDVGECEDGRLLDADSASRTIEAHRDLVRGIKVRVERNSVGNNGADPLRLAREVADDANVPLLVQFGPPPPTLGEILSLLRKGDILTHTFTGRGATILDRPGQLRPDVLAARERGVFIDVGHGATGFDVDVARKALEQGFGPDTISTDLHARVLDGPVFDLPTTMSKYIALGLTLTEVIRAAATRPARILGLEEHAGTLRPGAIADISVFELQGGTFTFTDSEDKSLTGSQRLRHVLTVCRGHVMEPETQEAGGRRQEAGNRRQR